MCEKQGRLSVIEASRQEICRSGWIAITSIELAIAIEEGYKSFKVGQHSLADGRGTHICLASTNVDVSV